jgi:hypothetical protein
MKKFYLVPGLFLALGGLTAVQAQDTTVCNAAFMANIQGNVVYFNAMDSLPGVRHSWNFGDGTAILTGSIAPVHLYAANGNYLVTQTVFDSVHNCQNSASQYVNITPPAPSCGVYITETGDSVHHQYTFIANPSFTPGTTDSVRWTINDTLAGQGDTLRRYLPGGPYNVCALLTTGDGCQSQSCWTINPYDSAPATPPPPPDTCTISLTATPKEHKPNQYVFTVVDHQDYDSISWTIIGPDSLFAGPFRGASLSYTFADTGYYLVYVAAEKKGGCPVFNEQAVHIDSIGPPPGQSITSYPNPATTQATLSVTLTNSATITVRVYNSMGGLVLTSNISGYPGANSITIPIANLPKGMYYIEVQYGSTTLRSKVQKLSN